MNRFRVALSALLMFAGALAARGDSVIRVGAEPGRHPMVYGFDFERLWHFVENKQEVDLDELARLAVGEVKVNHVKVAINGGAELEEGKINWRVYDQQLRIMRALRKARPDIKFFAVPRPIFNDMKNGPFAPYPVWINEYENPVMANPDAPRTFLRFHPDKAAAYLKRYFDFMAGHGFTFDYMYIKTEYDRFMRPAETVAAIRRLRELMGDAMPKVVTPASHNWQSGAAWLREAMAKGVTDDWDITATHNTAVRGTMQEFAAEARKLDKPYWNSELHAWGGPDDMAPSKMALLFDHVRAGYTGFTDWLTLGNEKKDHKPLRNMGGPIEVMRIYHIYKHLVNTSGGGFHLPTELPAGVASGAAFRRNDLLTVWALNDGEAALDGVALELPFPGARLAEVRYWGPSTPREGTVTSASSAAPPSRLEGKTLYCFLYRLPK
ncbi:MAG TPA: hypothetical protein PKE12_12585 [Kiritimatiellia bacterium]|nr:hypothetical protein [Kiritimatiellia bacterium]